MSLIIPLFLIGGLFFTSPEPSHAASGGRIGGGSFRAPSMPRTRGYGGSYRGGYGGGYGGYRGGGIGFPFLMPIFGFGGGGIFGWCVARVLSHGGIVDGRDVDDEGSGQGGVVDGTCQAAVDSTIGDGDGDDGRAVSLGHWGKLQ